MSIGCKKEKEPHSVTIDIGGSLRYISAEHARVWRDREGAVPIEHVTGSAVFTEVHSGSDVVAVA